MRAFIHKYCHYLLSWPRGFSGEQSGVLAVLAALAMPVLAKTMGRARPVRDASGVAAVEFAIIGPVLLLIVVGMFVFGTVLNNYVILTNAAEAGALQFAISRGASTPWTDTRNAILNVVPPTITPANLTMTLSVNGTACTSDSTCQTALTANVGKPAFVQATYPCSLIVLAVDYAPSCTLNVKTTERIQ